LCSALIVFTVFAHLVALRFDRLNSSLVKLALHIVLDSGTVIFELNEKKLCEFPQNIMQAFTKKTIEQSYCLRLFPRQESIVKSLENEKLNPHLQLNCKGTKTIASIVQHLTMKWLKALPDGHCVRLYPKKLNFSSVAHQGWGVSDGDKLTMRQLYMDQCDSSATTSQAPHVVQLEYDFVIPGSTKHSFVNPSSISSCTVQPQLTITAPAAVTNKNESTLSTVGNAKTATYSNIRTNLNGTSHSLGLSSINVHDLSLPNGATSDSFDLGSFLLNSNSGFVHDEHLLNATSQKSLGDKLISSQPFSLGELSIPQSLQSRMWSQPDVNSKGNLFSGTISNSGGPSLGVSLGSILNGNDSNVLKLDTIDSATSSAFTLTSFADAIRQQPELSSIPISSSSTNDSFSLPGSSTKKKRKRITDFFERSNSSSNTSRTRSPPRKK